MQLAALQSAAWMEEGRSADESLAVAPLPDFARGRMAAAAGSPPARLGDCLERLADECRDRFERKLDRTLLAATPVALVSFAVLLGLEFHQLSQPFIPFLVMGYVDAQLERSTKELPLQSMFDVLRLAVGQHEGR